MKTTWTKGLEPQKATEIKQEFIGGALLRERLITLLTEKQDNSLKKSRNEEAYANANWAYLQADARGYERALSEVISLISS